MDAYELMTETPKQLYLSKIEQGELQVDAAQAAMIESIDALYHVVRKQAVARHSGWSAWLRVLLGRSQPALEGLYFWGGVGRGKTMLMDLFVSCLSEERVVRMHFHRFMRRVHEGLRRHAGVANPLRSVADEFALEADVLCFDEFFVSDIGDAMILAETLAALFERNITLVATSNVEPKNLYANGLQRSRFLPAIDLLYKHCQVHHVMDGQDFRLRTLQQAGLFHSPLNAEAEQKLRGSFAALVPAGAQQGGFMRIEGRDIPVEQYGDGVAWFRFAALCEGPRSQNDYIELATLYHTVLISEMPLLNGDKEDAARRFISLVDEFYDRRVKLIITAAAGIAELYTGTRSAFEFDRTRSRLLEMQSTEYLSAAHHAVDRV